MWYQNITITVLYQFLWIVINGSEMSAQSWKRKYRKSGNNQKVSPETKKQKKLLNFTSSDKAKGSLKMAEKLNSCKPRSESQSSNSNIESKLDLILDKIKPIDEMS